MRFEVKAEQRKRERYIKGKSDREVSQFEEMCFMVRSTR